MKVFNLNQFRVSLLLFSFIRLQATANGFFIPQLSSVILDSRSNDLGYLKIKKEKFDTPMKYLKEQAFVLSAVSKGGGEEAIAENSGKCPLRPKAMLQFADKNFFVLGMAVAVWLAKTFPNLGVDKGILRPELYIGKLGVTFIFLCSGLSLELAELKDAANHHSLNGLVQLTSFLAWPFLIGLPVVKFLDFFSIFTPALREGILILTTLPTTVNMCVLLTSTAGGNVATALCNAVLGNMMGIFATPALLLQFFGTNIALPFGQMVGKLSNKVVVPVAIGQLLRKTPVLNFYKRHSKKFKRFQEVRKYICNTLFYHNIPFYFNCFSFIFVKKKHFQNIILRKIILLGIVWNAFSNAFAKGLGLEMNDAINLLILLASLHLSVLFALFNFFKFPKLNFSRGETIAATFCASHKTLAFGLPLIKTVFDGNPNLASYCAPIMLVHPLQLIIGSLLIPEFSWYTSGGDEKNI